MAAKGLKTPTGNVTYTPSEKVPDSTMYMRAYLKCAQPDGTMQYCAYGNSAGFFQVRSSSCSLSQTFSRYSTDLRTPDWIVQLIKSVCYFLTL